MIVDGFTFYNELDVLELRLRILEGVVDRFVVCESPFTFRGAPKPLYFAENRSRFAAWDDRIVHVVHADPPHGNPWINEWAQRANVSQGWADVPDDAIVMISDVDEIPAPDVLRTLDPKPGRAAAFLMLLSVGYANRVTSEPWLGTRAIRRRDLGGLTAHDLRGIPSELIDAVRGGWHFSLFGGPQMIAAKIGAYSHVEADIPYLNDVLRQEVFLENEVWADYVPLDGRFPSELRNPRWAKHVWQGPRVADRTTAEVLTHAHGCLAYVDRAADRVFAVADDEWRGWQSAGRQRFGERFAGVLPAIPDERASGPIAAGTWVVIDGFARCGLEGLLRLARRGATVVLYTPFVVRASTLIRVLNGETFPHGPAYGVREYEDLIARAGYRIAQRDDIMDSIFAPVYLIDTGVHDVTFGAFTVRGTTHALRSTLSTNAFVFTLVVEGSPAEVTE